MRQDPFEQLRRDNPVLPDQTPSAPIGVADRIVGSRSSPAGWVVAVAAAGAVVVIGGGSLLLVDRAQRTVVADATTTSAETTTTMDETATTTEESLTTTTVAETAATTLLPVVPTVSAVANADEVVVYLLAEERTATGPSPSLIPVARSLATLSSSDIDLPRTAVAFLLAGPTQGEADSTPSLTSAVPEGTRLLDVIVVDGVATVDLSAEFAASSGTYGEAARMEQLIFTLTRFDDIDGIRLRIDGEMIEVFGGHGIVLDGPVGRDALQTAIPAILIETPTYWATVGNPLDAAGTANVFEASVSLTLVDGDGLIIWEGFTTATCGTGCRGDWSIEIPYEVDVPQMGALIAWEESARDGSQINVREHPVWLVPSDDSPADTTVTTLAPDEYECSGVRVEGTLVEQPDLPADVAAMRSAIFAAAVSCDWEALRSLLAEDFMFSFGGPGDAVAYWQQLELLDEQPMRYLAGLLNRPYGTQPGPESDYYTWPSAFATEWSLVSESDREALRPLYDEEDFAVFDDFGGYLGYRVGIIDGTWAYFIAGD